MILSPVIFVLYNVGGAPERIATGTEWGGFSLEKFMARMFGAVVSAFCAVATGASAQINAGAQAPEANLPFTLTPVTTFDCPGVWPSCPTAACWSPKKSAIDLVTQQGAKTEVGGTPPVYYQGQNGLLGVFLSPHYAADHNVYLTYVEPGEYGGGLAMGRGQLMLDGDRARLTV